jgi:hypothetical protein
MALHLRPWNTNFIKLCSVRYYATPTSIEGAKSDAKTADTGVQCRDCPLSSRSNHHEVMHAAQCTQHVHNLHEVTVTNFNTLHGNQFYISVETIEITRILLPQAIMIRIQPNAKRLNEQKIHYQYHSPMMPMEWMIVI